MSGTETVKRPQSRLNVDPDTLSWLRPHSCGTVENPPWVFQALSEGGPSEGRAFHRASDPRDGFWESGKLRSAEFRGI